MVGRILQTVGGGLIVHGEDHAENEWHALGISYVAAAAAASTTLATPAGLDIKLT